MTTSSNGPDRDTAPVYAGFGGGPGDPLWLRPFEPDQIPKALSVQYFPWQALAAQDDRQRLLRRGLRSLVEVQVMKMWIGVALVAAAVALGAPAAVAGSKGAPQPKEQMVATSAATDFSAHRRYYRRYYRPYYRPYGYYNRPYYAPYYYARPYYYRPYPYYAPFPFAFGFGFGPYW